MHRRRQSHSDPFFNFFKVKEQKCCLTTHMTEKWSTLIPLSKLSTFSKSVWQLLRIWEFVTDISPRSEAAGEVTSCQDVNTIQGHLVVTLEFRICDDRGGGQWWKHYAQTFHVLHNKKLTKWLGQAKRSATQLLVNHTSIGRLQLTKVICICTGAAFCKLVE